MSLTFFLTGSEWNRIYERWDVEDLSHEYGRARGTPDVWFVWFLLECHIFCRYSGAWTVKHFDRSKMFDYYVRGKQRHKVWLPFCWSKPCLDWDFAFVLVKYWLGFHNRWSFLNSLVMLSWHFLHSCNWKKKMLEALFWYVLSLNFFHSSMVLFVLERLLPNVDNI